MSMEWLAPSLPTRLLLQMLQLRGVGPAAVRKIANQLLRRPSSAIYADLEANFSELSVAADRHQAQDRASQIIDDCRAGSIAIISIPDPYYPARLRSVRDAPPIIYVRGNVGALEMDGGAVVGTRHASRTGERIARRIAGLLAMDGFSTISGLALGIDAAAHSGALDAHGVTIAIMAHGLDTIAPRTNRELAFKLLEFGGALISEHPPRVPPRPAEFVRRNRIQSGMALFSVVVESGEVGGSIHQARFTREQGRTLFAVLPDARPEQDFNSSGGELLVREFGAIPLRSAQDFESHLMDFRREEPRAGNLFR